MAAIRTHEGTIAIISGISVGFYNIRAPESFTSITIPQESDTKRELEQEVNDDASSCSTLAGGNKALAAAFSRHGRYFAVCDDRKYLHLYADDTGHWTLVSSKILARRATSVLFTCDDSAVLVADKSGDVYSFLTERSAQASGEGQVEGQPLLGHLSMILDMRLAAKDSLIVTCDRDEKIRVSRYPNAYNIHAYCLGHREFVSCIEYIEDLDLLISASGDCSVRVWDLQGKQLCQTQCLPYHPAVESSATATQEASTQETGDISREDGSQKVATPERQRPAIQRLAFCSHCRCLAVTFYSCPQVMMYQLTAAGGHTALTHAQTIPLTADAWDITFEGDVLWVLSPVEGATLTAYQVETKEAGDGIQLTEITDSGSSAFQVTKSVNAKWDFFKDALHVASPVPTLWKIASQANVAEYQQRKEKRLQEHSSKRAANSPRGRRLPGKKARNTS